MNRLVLCPFIVQYRPEMYDEIHALLGAFMGACLSEYGGLLISELRGDQC